MDREAQVMKIPYCLYNRLFAAMPEICLLLCSDYILQEGDMISPQIFVCAVRRLLSFG